MLDLQKSVELRCLLSRFLTPSVPGNETFGEAVLVPFPRFRLPQASLKTNPNKGVPSTHGIPKGGRVPQSSSGFLGTPKNFRKVLNDVDEVCGEGSQVLIIEGCPAGALGSTPISERSLRRKTPRPARCWHAWRVPQAWNQSSNPFSFNPILRVLSCPCLLCSCFLFLVLSCPCHVLVLFCHSLSNPFSFFVFCHVPCLLCSFRCFFFMVCCICCATCFLFLPQFTGSALGTISFPGALLT